MRSMLNRGQSIHRTAAMQLRICVDARRKGFAFVAVFAYLLLSPVSAQQVEPKAVIVQPGAPGQPTRTLPSTTKATLSPRSQKDVEFMQGMIMHHAQAVEMTALIEARTKNKDIILLGARISQSQSDEMKFMKQWLESRGEPITMTMSATSGSHSHGSHSSQQMMMPGMLSPKQMSDLADAKGSEFDRLFLTGMIQHHIGALVMVKDLFNTAGAGQDAELFNFATDVDSGQRAEIRIMETMRDKKP